MAKIKEKVAKNSTLEKRMQSAVQESVKILKRSVDRPEFRNLKEDRLKSNLLILKELEKYCKKNPHLRFGQVIVNAGLGIYDSGAFYYDEPSETLEKLRKFIKNGS